MHKKRSCAIVRGSAERWQSGRLYLTRNHVGQPTEGSNPSPPPERHKALRGLLFFQRSCNALTALALPRSPPWEQSRGQTRRLSGTELHGAGGASRPPTHRLCDCHGGSCRRGYLEKTGRHIKARPDSVSPAISPETWFMPSLKQPPRVPVSPDGDVRFFTQVQCFCSLFL